MTLRANKGQGMRLSEIADALSVTAATASEAVRTLVQKGFVAKRQALEDARAVTLSLTKQGVSEATAVERWPSFLLEAVDQVAPADRASMLRGVITIISSLQRSGRIPAAQMCINCSNFRANVHVGQRQPHHCQLIDAPIGDAELRTHCSDHEPASAELHDQNFEKFTAPPEKDRRRLPVHKPALPKSASR